LLTQGANVSLLSVINKPETELLGA
jgi:hypothetical protein